VSGKVSAPGVGSFVLYSAYFKCGEDWSAENLDIAEAVRLHANKHGLPWMLGADWNMEPVDVAKNDLPRAMDATLIYPGEEATCIAPACARTLDFFMVHGLTAGVKEVKVVTEAGTRPHRPVQLTLAAALKSATKTIFRPSPKLPTEPIIGPVREPPSLEVAKLLALQSIDHFNAGETEQGFKAYDIAFASFAATAEIAVAQATDTPVPTQSSRASKPQRVKVPLAPELNRNGKDNKLTTALSNLLQRAQETTAMINRAVKGGRSMWEKLKSVTTWRTTSCRDLGGDAAQEEKQEVIRLYNAAAELADINLRTDTPPGRGPCQARGGKPYGCRNPQGFAWQEPKG